MPSPIAGVSVVLVPKSDKEIVICGEIGMLKMAITS